MKAEHLLSGTGNAFRNRMLRRSVFRIDPSMVYFLRFILEGYDNLFVLSTIDSTEGLVEIHYAKGAEDDLHSVLEEAGNFIGLAAGERA